MWIVDGVGELECVEDEVKARDSPAFGLMLGYARFFWAA